MRFVFVLLVLTSLPVYAQAPDASRAEAPPLGHRVVLVGAAVGGTALALVAGPFAPFATAPVVYWTGYQLGYDAPYGRVVVDWAIGAAAGFVTYHGLVFAALELNGGTLGLAEAAVGLGVSAVVTALLYEADVSALDLAPTAFRLDDGRTAPGVSLRVAL